MNKLSKKIILLLVALVIVLVALGTWFGSVIAKGGGDSEFSAVFLSTGDIYFGKLSWFPRPTIEEVWFLQRTTDQEGAQQLSIVPFTGAFWGPSDKINLNPDNIIFWAQLRDDSVVAQALVNPQGVPSLPAGGQVPVDQGIAPTEGPGGAMVNPEGAMTK